MDEETKETVVRWIGLLAVSIIAFFLSPGCGGGIDTDADADAGIDTGMKTDIVETDTGVEDGSDSSEQNSDAGDITKDQLKQLVCDECQNRNKVCPENMTMKGDAPSEPNISALADRFCEKGQNCSNPEFSEGEPCDKPCAQEREVRCYAWTCPSSIHENDKTYSVKVDGDKCMMKNEHGWGSPGEYPKGRYKYDGGNELERYNSATGKWVTCKGEPVKEDRAICSNL